METREELAERITQLRQVRLELLDKIEKSKKALDRVNFAISVLDGTMDPTLAFSHEVSMTKKGNIRNLAKAIIDELKDRGVVLTASDMANAMFNTKMELSPDQLRRRLSVKTSAMFKKESPSQILDSGLKNDRREIYWALPEWMTPDGKVNQNRVPHEVSEHS